MHANLAARVLDIVPLLSLYGAVIFTFWASVTVFMAEFPFLPESSQRTCARIVGVVAAEPSSEVSSHQARMLWKFPMRIEAITPHKRWLLETREGGSASTLVREQQGPIATLWR